MLLQLFLGFQPGGVDETVCLINAIWLKTQEQFKHKSWKLSLGESFTYKIFHQSSLHVRVNCGFLNMNGLMFFYHLMENYTVLTQVSAKYHLYKKILFRDIFISKKCRTHSTTKYPIPPSVIQIHYHLVLM